MTKINGDKPLFQYSHSCPIFSYYFCHSFCRLCSRPPAASWPSSHFCPLWDMPTALLPASLSQLPVLGRASWLEAQSQLPDQWQTAGKGWGTCWEQLLAVLCKAAGRGCGCLYAPGLKTKPCSKESSTPEKPAFLTTACLHCQDTPSAPTRAGERLPKCCVSNRLKKTGQESFRWA